MFAFFKKLTAKWFVDESQDIQKAIDQELQEINRKGAESFGKIMKNCVCGSPLTESGGCSNLIGIPPGMWTGISIARDGIPSVISIAWEGIPSVISITPPVISSTWREISVVGGVLPLPLPEPSPLLTPVPPIPPTIQLPPGYTVPSFPTLPGYMSPTKGNLTCREYFIRTKAYEYWETEGRPEGRELDHWLRAEADWNANG